MFWRRKDSFGRPFGTTNLVLTGSHEKLRCFTNVANFVFPFKIQYSTLKIHLFSTPVNNSLKKRLPSFGYICPFRRFWCTFCSKGAILYFSDRKTS